MAINLCELMFTIYSKGSLASKNLLLPILLQREDGVG